MFAIFNLILMTLLAALLAGAALRAGDQTEIFRVERAKQGFTVGKDIINAYYYEKNRLPAGNLSNLQTEGYAPLSLSEMASYSAQTGLTEAVSGGELGWTYDRAMLAVQRASNVRDSPTFLNQNNCVSSDGGTAFSSAKSWCPTDVVTSRMWETRADMATRTARIRSNMQRSLQKFADFYSAHPSPKKFPQMPVGAMELRALVGQSALASASCTGVFTNQFVTGIGDNYTYLVWDCADLFTPYGQPVTYSWVSNTEIRLSAPVGVPDQAGNPTNVGINFAL